MSLPYFDSDSINLPIKVLATCWSCGKQALVTIILNNTNESHIEDGVYNYETNGEYVHICSKRNNGKFVILNVELGRSHNKLKWTF